MARDDTLHTPSDPALDPASTDPAREPVVPPGTDETVTPADLEVIHGQLGRLRYTPRRVASRCPAGFPRVVQAFRGKGPGASTNVYWLTCPHLRKQIDRLEGTGAIRRIEGDIASDPDRAARLAADQERYMVTVRAIVAELDPDTPRPLTGHGIGGVSDPSRLKCLHAHMAFHLASGEGEVGDTVFALLESGASREAIELCPPGRCPDPVEPRRQDPARH